jgi:Nif-specific regulatory protein
MFFLLLEEPGRSAQKTPLESKLFVGRREDANIVLTYTDVSRNHAEFDPRNDGVFLRDLGSRAGTFVNGVRITEARLSAGDVVRIGAAKLTLLASRSLATDDADSYAALDLETLESDDPRMRVVLELSRTMSAGIAPDELLVRMLDAILRVLGADRAIAALGDTHRSSVLRYVVRRRDGQDERTDLPMIAADAIDALMANKTVLIQEENKDGTCAIGAPLVSGERHIGFLYVDGRGGQSSFTRDDRDFLHALARLTATALDSAERYERASAIAEADSGGLSALTDIMGQSPAIMRLKDQIRRYAPASGTFVLIRGESGTGKELVARAIHAASPRAPRPFITVNCAAIPESMIEGELFGYEKGAFAGAQRGRRGRFMLAHHGTLLLDEISDLSLQAQGKVLRATQNGEIAPLGAEQLVTVDVRILASTHKDLQAEVAAGRFREDLFHRLNVVEVHIPPLRERGDDLLTMARSFLEAMALNLGKRMTDFSPAASAALLAYSWPGNVRELKNTIERAVLDADGEIVQLDDLGPSFSKGTDGGQSIEIPTNLISQDGHFAPTLSLAQRYAALDVVERTLVQEAISTARGNLAEAARLLGITRIMLKRRTERYGIRVRES